MEKIKYILKKILKTKKKEVIIAGSVVSVVVVSLIGYIFSIKTSDNSKQNQQLSQTDQNLDEQQENTEDLLALNDNENIEEDQTKSEEMESESVTSDESTEEVTTNAETQKVEEQVDDQNLSSNNHQTNNESKPSQPTIEQPKPEPQKPEQTKPETPKPEVPKGINSTTVANLKAAQNSDNILIVSASSVNSKDITAYYYEKNGGSWKESFKVAGTVGRNGINKVGEGDKRTPTGIFSITKLFGLEANPVTKLSYHQLTGSEYWCGGKFYNQWVDENTMDHSGCNKKDDEHLASYPIVYDYVAALNFNSANVAGKGSAIFIHCLRNTGSPTAGCIALPKTQMKYFMQRLNTSTKVIIDLESNILNY